MKYTIREVEHLETASELGAARIRVVVELDHEATALLGRVDAIALMGTITFDFGEHMSEAAILSAIRNELTRRKIAGLTAGRLAHLKGKVFDL